MYGYPTVSVLDIRKHISHVDHWVQQRVGIILTVESHLEHEFAKVRIMLQILGKIVHQRAASLHDIFHCLKNAISVPLSGKLFVDQFANVAHQKRIPVRVSVNLLAYRLDVHTRMRVVFVIAEHLGNLLGVEGHIDVEIGGDVPRGIVLFLRVRPEFELEVLHVIHARENHAVECGVHPLNTTLQILVAKHTQKIEEQLVVTALIHLVNGQNHRFGRLFGETSYSFRQLVQVFGRTIFPYIYQSLFNTSRFQTVNHLSCEHLGERGM